MRSPVPSLRLLQAVVTYDDYSPGISGSTSAHSVVYCRTSLTITSWLWSPTVPAVTGISNSFGQITGSSVATTLTGTGFFSGASVSFMQESGGTVVNGGRFLLPTSR